MTHHIVLGGGAAGLSAIEAIRAIDAGGGRISLISSEPAYRRADLPAWLAQRITKPELLAADDAYFARLKVDRYIGVPATRINPRAKTVTMKGGQILPFDDLLIATGAAPVLPTLPGIDLPGVQPVWTLAQAEAVHRLGESLPEPEVVLLGAGFIAMVLLDALRQRGWKLHVVELSDRILPDVLDGAAAQLLQDQLRQKGVGLHVGSAVSEIKMAEGRKLVVLANRTTLAADLVIVATGTRPNLDIAKGAGIQTAQGIVVNERMQTNFPDIYAAGDVAQAPGEAGQSPNQPRAVDQGRVAGGNMAGQEFCYAGSTSASILECDLLRAFDG